ncbi:MAG: hypothetical protein A3G49_06075 [Candidatus Sungbacteria bacterium RIFCSPLOWO2_12_FULL_41_11]|uniref:Uncharacterized protein n=1 Tax=Candidatus Sungbacteria bacterium RIFCSPLOWO2_12_FULL_41_11 TaxID=1802286 RepID=A0A1G2LR29_9BACT|nr:MAG: hypothetical protein UV01_C0004G0134 [Parcubacteria group bacterium GW2011_GWA2_42_14]OGZ99596.1 MAG: hypothetical protein A3D41_00010 [Candidatus Sungbacteria bacterium RIFCSPHIGHO2_02_FULL_41_12b]OHA14003.1 MAG: hypothetical protein A3G49_06075 [Candidatus Sungbacteria bacterium RIFCSPLOWO2_12_FULL_41_11]
MSEDTDKIFGNTEAEELLGKAADLFYENKYEAAETVLKEVIEKFPEFFPGWAASGDFYLNVGRPDKALAPLRKAVRLSFYEGIGHYLLGAAYIKVARFHLAERELEAAEKLLEEKADVKAHLGRAKFMLGKIEEGRKLIAEAVNDDPDNSFIRCDLAQTYVAEKNFTEALRLAENISSDDPFFKKNAAFIRKLKEDFDRLTPEEQEKNREESLSGKAGQKMRIEMLLGLADAGEGLTKEDMAEITEEMRLFGLTGQITMMKDENDPKSKDVLEFIKMHEELGLGMGNKVKKFSSAEIRELTDALLEDTPVLEKKKTLVKLASSGHKKALGTLKRFCENPRPGELKFWAELAYDECRLINSGVSETEPPVIFRNLEEN